MSDGEDTPKKQGLSAPWQPGQSGNPAGRPKGARNKLGELFLEDLLAAWESQGPAAIKTVIEKKPQDFLKVVASLMPKDLNVNVNTIGEMTDEQLLDRIRKLDATIQPFLATQGENGTGGGDRKKTTH